MLAETNSDATENETYPTQFDPYLGFARHIGQICQKDTHTLNFPDLDPSKLAPVDDLAGTSLYLYLPM